MHHPHLSADEREARAGQEGLLEERVAVVGLAPDGHEEAPRLDPPPVDRDGGDERVAGDGSGGATGQNAPPARPQQVALGDTAMQIKPQGGNAPGVVGAERTQAVGKDVPQQYDARTPGGGQQSGSRSGNQGVEKGRVMPSGI